MNSCHEGVRDRNRDGILYSGREHPPRAMSVSETGHWNRCKENQPRGSSRMGAGLSRGSALELTRLPKLPTKLPAKLPFSLPASITYGQSEGDITANGETVEGETTVEAIESAYTR
eukprot:gene17589-biopygen5052